MDMTIALCLALIAAAPFLIHKYVRQLPVAPACPCCSATTRQASHAADLFRFVPHLAATTLGECSQCGWRGRMRWRWAPRREHRTRR
jgi:hypothetical protein